MSCWSGDTGCSDLNNASKHDSINSMRLQLLNTTLCLLAAGLTANGAPLQRADLPADPAWVVHVDVDGLRPTSLGQFLQAEMDKPEAQAKLAAVQTIFSFDPRTQLHGLTLYCAGATAQEGVLLVYADFDAARLLTLAKAAKEYEATPYKQHTIHSWLDEKKKAKDGHHPRVYAAIQGKRVIFGQQAANIGRALDVLDGAVPTLAASKAFAALGAAGDKSFLEAAARKLDLPTGDPSAALFRLSKAGRLQVNEAGGQVHATLTLEATSEDIAVQMSSIGQGLVGLLKLQQGKPEALTLANGLVIKQEGPQVVATLSLPSGDLVNMVKADAARKAAKKAQEKHAEEESK
jgi:hypothetical protein